MSGGRKYANLPDLDPAPDVYETPDLIDDTSTIKTSTANRSESSASSYYDPEEDGSGIDRHRLDPGGARSHFLPAERNRRDLGLADRIEARRRQYRDPSQRRRNDGQGIAEDYSLSDEDEESLERKVARLRQELAEVKGEFERRRATEKKDETEIPTDEADTLEALSQVLNGPSGAADRLKKKLSTASKTYGSSNSGPSTEPAHAVTASPHQNRTLYKVADFDARITLIESALGVDTIPLPTQERTPTRAVIPLLDLLAAQLSVLSYSTDSSLDSISRRVRQLTQETQKLAEARAAAKAAQEGLNSERKESGRPLANGEATINAFIDDPEQISKINALYGTLSTIESLAPSLPAVLDRLRSLHSIHADAAAASQSLAQLETRQEAMAEELKAWRDGLEKVEIATKEGEQTMGDNATVVETWVKELEDRMSKLGH